MKPCHKIIQDTIFKENNVVCSYTEENFNKKIIYTTQKVESPMSQSDIVSQNPFKQGLNKSSLWIVYMIFENYTLCFCKQVENIWDKYFYTRKMK